MSANNSSNNNDNSSSNNDSLLKFPPPDAKIPAPPQGFVPTHGHDYRGLLPKKTELAVLPDVVVELRASADFNQLFGKTIPPLATVLQTLDAAQQWSSMRAKSSEWDLYCRTQEGLAWKDTRALIASMKPAFDLAVSVDATIAGRYPSLAHLLSAGTAIAKRAVATKKANKKLVAEGKAPTKGVKAKKSTKKAQAATPPRE
jgi:hypothetical protein